MQISERDLEMAQRMDRSATEEAVRRVRLEGESNEARRVASALERLRQLAIPVQESATVELLAFDPNIVDPEGEGFRKNILHKILGQDLLRAANTIKDEGVTGMMAVRSAGEKDPIATPLAFVRGDAITAAFISALARKGDGVLLTPSDSRWGTGARRELFPTRVSRAYIIKTAGQDGGYADSAELIAATPGYVESQMPKSPQSRRR